MSPRSQHDNIHEHEHEILNPLKMCIFVLVFYCSLGCVAVPLTLVFENEINVNLPYLLFFLHKLQQVFLFHDGSLDMDIGVANIGVAKRETLFWEQMPPPQKPRQTYIFFWQLHTEIPSCPISIISNHSLSDRQNFFQPVDPPPSQGVYG